jgi:hypothetical protein
MFQISVHIKGEVREVPRLIEDEDAARAECLRWFDRHWHPDAEWRVKDLATGRRWEATLTVHGTQCLLELPKELRPCSVPGPACH